MRRFKLVVFSEGREGQDAEYNRWYNEQHLDDVCALEGFTAAQRFKLHSVSMGKSLNDYMAIYDVETDDPDWVIENLFAHQDTDAMPIATAFNMDNPTVMLYEELTEVVKAKDEA